MTGLMTFKEPVLPQALLASLRGAEPVRCIIVGAGSRLALETAVEARKLGLIEPVLIGPSSDMDRVAEEIGCDLAEFERLEAGDEASIAALSAQAARDFEAGFVIKGSVHTDAYLRAFLSRDAGFRDHHGTVPGAVHLPICPAGKGRQRRHRRSAAQDQRRRAHLPDPDDA